MEHDPLRRWRFQFVRDLTVDGDAAGPEVIRDPLGFHPTGRYPRLG
ncbi:hypothetical protein [Pseudonocardia sp.]|nr:hypothetical protein [Pseudonocardia sp.]